MQLKKSWVLLGVAILGVCPASAFAAECTVVFASMMATAKTPYKSTINRPGKDGKPEIIHLIQTPTDKYVEMDGKWVSFPVSSEEMIEKLNDLLKEAKITCHLEGSSSVNGQPASIYTVHTEAGGNVSDNKIWISPENLPLKSETKIGDSEYISTYDYNDVQSPIDATPMGTK